MVIRFDIPNGRMEINLETFFQEAGKTQIRKMLKLLSQSRPDEGQVREIRGWLEERIRVEKAGNGNWASRKLAEKYACVLAYADKILGG